MENRQAITVHFDVAATMRDGTVLRANVYRPSGEGRWPVLLLRTPYGKDGMDVRDYVQAARRGYVVIVQDTRGRFASEGAWDPFQFDAEDGADTVGWAAGLPYTDGQVGMFGCSADGLTQWAAATERPPALKALVPFEAPSDLFNGTGIRSGAVELGLLAAWFLGLGFDVLARRHREEPEALEEAVRALCREIDDLVSAGYRALPLARFAPLRRHDIAPEAFFDVIAAPMDRGARVSQPFRILDRRERIRVPTFLVGGWYDVNLGDTLASFTTMRAQGNPTKLLIGAWSHGTSSQARVGELTFGVSSQLGFIDRKSDFASLQLRWFDHWLKGIDTGMMAEPPIKLFMMGANVWRDEEEWPLARAVDTPYYLHADGGLSAEPPDGEPPDRYDYDPSDPVPTRGGALAMASDYPPGPFDQRPIEARPDVVVYTTLPVERDTEVTGPIEVCLWATSSAPDTDFVARLVDVYPDGRSINLTDGIVRARYRDFRKGEPPSLIEPGHPYAYTIDLWATSNVFKVGHRIGLHVTSSNFPRWDRNPNTGHAFGADAELRVAHQEILHDRTHPSRVRLPLIPGE
jgi:putative CocE/NonD family hydrolase